MAADRLDERVVIQVLKLSYQDVAKFLWLSVFYVVWTEATTTSSLNGA